MEEMKKFVRDAYGKIAKGFQNSCCSTSSCCNYDASSISSLIGYSQEEMSSVPDGSNLGLGCGNPTALAVIKEGDTVLDLGSGAGFDCFLVAKKVGLHGKVIGVDMTSEMLNKARQNGKKGDYSNVEFRLGEIENLPVANDSVDLIISNCVINLSDNKSRVFEEAFRVLRSGGKVSVSDIVLFGEIPKEVKNSVAAYVGCFSGAILKDEYLEIMKSKGFVDVKVVEEVKLDFSLVTNDPNANLLSKELGLTSSQIADLMKAVVSVKIVARKP